MGATLQKSALSPNIRERRDFSCAVFDAERRLIAQAAHIPVHLGSMGRSVVAVTEACELAPGDAVLHNDPYHGGTHLPDLTLVSAVYLGRARRPAYYCASRAHHADVGGAHPGSMTAVDEIHAEGLRLSPIHLVRRGALDGQVLALLLANMRDSGERRGDLLAQWAANRRGVARMAELASEQHPSILGKRSSELIEWTQRRVAALIRSLPSRTVRFADVLDPVQPGGAPVRIQVALKRAAGELVVDFSGSDAQLGSSLNATRAVTEAAVAYVLQLLLPPGTPINEGSRAGVRVVTPQASVVDAAYPAPVAAGNVETSQRIVDVLLGAFARWLPGQIPAASSGTMSNLSFGGAHAGRRFAYYETIAGGAGAGPQCDGAHALHTHMTNTRNTPIEEFERRFPVRITRSTVRRGSGGAGAHCGGDGVEKCFVFLAPAHVAWIAERTLSRPWGLDGGEPGAGGNARVRLGGRSRSVAGRSKFSVAAGDVFELATPGGGGHGRAARRRRRRGEHARD
ncbi:MAG: hydantoinase B/oxoprolinase family protein [Planctomycetes bacterium]|nr:hydantoinase B/oxoprolinase family protein [Planctomycetota bacterium]